MGNFEHQGLESCIGRYRDMTDEERGTYLLLLLTDRTEEALEFRDRCEQEKERGEEK